MCCIKQTKLISGPEGTLLCIIFIKKKSTIKYLFGSVNRFMIKVKISEMCERDIFMTDLFFYSSSQNTPLNKTSFSKIR